MIHGLSCIAIWNAGSQTLGREEDFIFQLPLPLPPPPKKKEMQKIEEDKENEKRKVVYLAIPNKIILVDVDQHAKF